MKASASGDLAAALAAATVHARAQHGARSRPETGKTDAGSFDTVLNDVQGAPDTSSDKTAGSRGHVGTPSAAKGAGHEPALRAEDGGSAAASAVDGAAVNAAAVVAGSMPSAIAAQQGAPPAVAGLGTPDFEAVSTSTAVATTPPTVAVALTRGQPDPRLSVPGAALAGTAQPAAPQNAGAQANGAQAIGVQASAAQTRTAQADAVQTVASQRGITFPAATGLTPADSGTAVPGDASDAPQLVTSQPPAGSGSLSPLGVGSAGPNTSPTAVLAAVGATAAVAAVAAPRVVASVTAPAASVTAADANGTVGFLTGLPGVAPAETKPVDNMAVDNTAPAAPSAAVAAAGTAVPGAAPVGQPSSAPVPAATPQPASAAPQTAAALQPQLVKPLFTLVGAPHGQHVMTLNVSPEDLGPLTVRAHIDAAGVRIELFAAGDAGREAVRGILPELRKELTGAGFGASLDLSEHSGPGGAAQDRAGQGTAGRGGAGGDPGGNDAGQGSRNGPGEPRGGNRWDGLADNAALRSATTLNGPQTTLDILV
ncbi:Flagellar hook-length control protein FliK [Arthrobacter sp. ov407]|uniref:flagellar hook-length control protein FliK n=1 Tax=Arthrobacter sp. ov407 TaxID=1761748 RepID=UPI00088361FC|nr:flagellar hook-length control protein FliK [Arthrobacter sp. ov407]SDL67430.1 Flagellar hook-length control protein FliK [Arthrobacter sp. ov407]